MGSKDKRIDSYIAKAAPFAQPILTHLRAVVHAGCPAATETIKWGHPFFEHKGVLCSMAAFKAHCAFGFWHSEMTRDAPSRSGEAMGQFGRITRLADLPKDAALKALVKKAAALNDAGVKSVRNTRPDGPRPIVVPDDLAAALSRNAKARATFDAFSNTHKREYVDWIVDAKRDETRASRIATALEWMAEGKSKEWRYQK
jgi:uncharacterized protein YdeI (YjbR/CyaY-like superfamily)